MNRVTHPETTLMVATLTRKGALARQQLAPSPGEPGFLGPRLAQRAMPVAAGVIEVARAAAGLAGLDMAAEIGGAAGDDGAPDLCLGSGQRMRREIRRCMAAQDVGQTRAAGCRGHAGALSGASGRAVPAARRCR